jgi:hypothetical protein
VTDVIARVDAGFGAQRLIRRALTGAIDAVLPDIATIAALSAIRLALVQVDAVGTTRLKVTRTGLSTLSHGANESRTARLAAIATVFRVFL